MVLEICEKNSVPATALNHKMERDKYHSFCVKYCISVESLNFGIENLSPFRN